MTLTRRNIFSIAAALSAVGILSAAPSPVSPAPPAQVNLPQGIELAPVGERGGVFKLNEHGIVHFCEEGIRVRAARGYQIVHGRAGPLFVERSPRFRNIEIPEAYSEMDIELAETMRTTFYRD